MRAGIDIDDVDRVDGIEVLFHGKRRIGIDHAGVEPGAQDGCYAGLFAPLTPLPFVIAVPGRRLTNLGGIFVDGGIDIGHARLNAGLEDRHVDEGGADVDDDLGPRFRDQGLGRFDIEGIELMGLDDAGLFERLLFEHARNDGLALVERARGDMDIAEHVVCHCSFMGDDLRHTSGTDNQYVLFHFSRNTFSEVEPSYATLSKSGSHPRLRQAPRVVLKRELPNEFHLPVQVTYRY